MSGIDGQDRGGTMAVWALVIIVVVIGAGVLLRLDDPVPDTGLSDTGVADESEAPVADTSVDTSVLLSNPMPLCRDMASRRASAPAGPAAPAGRASPDGQSALPNPSGPDSGDQRAPGWPMPQDGAARKERPRGGVTCVVDGDTIKLEDWPVRLWGIDTPETRKGRGGYACESERIRGEAAAEALVDLMSGGIVTTAPTRADARPEDYDNFGRLLARVLIRPSHESPAVDASVIDASVWLIAAGHAVPWGGRGHDWCGGLAEVHP